jgi:ubiquinone/menaquinone biosynthesis C-methylase UbiE
MSYDPQSVRGAYDAIAEREDRFEKGFSLRNAIPRELIKEYLQPSDVVLDAGGGTGINAILMAARCARVTLVDLSPKILQLAAANIREAGLAERIDVVEGDVCDLSQFSDGAFSFVTCVGGVISYLRERAQDAVRELARVAARGSMLVLGCDSRLGFVRWLLSEGQPGDLLDVAVEVYREGRYEAAEGVFARLYTPSELVQLAGDAGCEVVLMGSTPALMTSWDQSEVPAAQRPALIALEREVCTAPELLGTGSHLFCVARKA